MLAIVERLTAADESSSSPKQTGPLLLLVSRTLQKEISATPRKDLGGNEFFLTSDGGEGRGVGKFGEVKGGRKTGVRVR